MPQDFTTGQVLTAAQMDTLSGAVDGYATTATAAGTTTLTTASLYQQFFTGVTTQTVVLPVASTLYTGQKFRIVNNSSGVVTVQSSGANTVYAVPAGSDVIFTCILASGTSAASWDYKNYIASASASGLTLIRRSTFSNVAGTGTTFDDVFTSTYKTYFVDIEKIYGTYADDLQLQFRYAGPTTQAANYNTSAITATAGSATVTNNTAANATEAMLSIYSGLSASPQAAALYFNGVGNASETPSYQGTNFNQESDSITINGGRCYTARTYTGFLLKGAASNIYGTVAVYGLAAA